MYGKEFWPSPANCQLSHKVGTSRFSLIGQITPLEKQSIMGYHPQSATLLSQVGKKIGKDCCMWFLKEENKPTKIYIYRKRFYKCLSATSFYSNLLFPVSKSASCIRTENRQQRLKKAQQISERIGTPFLKILLLFNPSKHSSFSAGPESGIFPL